MCDGKREALLRCLTWQLQRLIHLWTRKMHCRRKRRLQHTACLFQLRRTASKPAQQRGRRFSVAVEAGRAILSRRRRNKRKKPKLCCLLVTKRSRCTVAASVLCDFRGSGSLSWLLMTASVCSVCSVCAMVVGRELCLWTTDDECLERCAMYTLYATYTQ